jgi:hypothetical protein
VFKSELYFITVLFFCLPCGVRLLRLPRRPSRLHSSSVRASVGGHTKHARTTHRVCSTRRACGSRVGASCDPVATTVPSCPEAAAWLFPLCLLTLTGAMGRTGILTAGMVLMSVLCVVVRVRCVCLSVCRWSFSCSLAHAAASLPSAFPLSVVHRTPAPLFDSSSCSAFVGAVPGSSSSRPLVWCVHLFSPREPVSRVRFLSAKDARVGWFPPFLFD